MGISYYWFNVYHPSKKGKQARIGPFLTRNDANHAKAYYGNRAGKVFQTEKEVMFRDDRYIGSVY